jgi:uncharacterized protein YecA (UPF0149 family)
MDSGTGRIHHASQEEIKRLEQLHNRPFIPLTEQQAAEAMLDKRAVRKNRMRNKPCPCGRLKKFKHCCWSKYA